MTITAPDAPTLPSLNDPANFNTRALALFSWLVTEYIPWLETLAGVTEDGEINGTPIGQKAAAAGKFTTLLADSLGGAAVQSSATDATVGKLMKVGAFGLGGSSLPTLDDCNKAGLVSGIYRTNSSTLNGPPAGNDWGMMFVLVAGPIVTQLWLSDGTSSFHAEERMWVRSGSMGGTYSDWQQMITGVGNQKINGKLQVEDGSAGHAIADNFVVSKNAGDVGMSLLTRDGDGFARFYLGSQTDTQAAKVQHNENTDELTVQAKGDLVLQSGGTNDHVTVDSSGKVGIGRSPAAYLDVLNNVAGHAANFESGSGNASNNHAMGVSHNSASFTNDVVRIIAAKSGNSDYSLLTARSGGGADIEFLLTGDGLGKSDRGWEGTGADYAEYFEWLDGNPDAETRTGLSVVLDGDKIRPAQDGETPIGVISANPSVVGDGDIDRWKGKYLRDDSGAYIWEDYEAVSWTETVTETETVQEQATEAQERTREVIEVTNGQAVKKIVTETVQVPLFDEFPLVDEAGNDLGTYRVPRMVEVVRETAKDVGRSYAADEVPEGVTVPTDAERVTQKRRKLNPEYDPSQPYIPRAERPEWDLVGLMGKLRIRKGQPVAPSWIKMRDVSAEVEEWLVK